MTKTENATGTAVFTQSCEPSETRKVFRKGKLIGSVMREDGTSEWRLLWASTLPRDREEVDLQLKLLNA